MSLIIPRAKVAPYHVEGTPDPDPVRALIATACVTLETTQAGLADILGVSVKTVEHWITTGDHRRQMPETAQRLLRLLVHKPRLVRLLDDGVVVAGER